VLKQFGYGCAECDRSERMRYQARMKWGYQCTSTPQLQHEPTSSQTRRFKDVSQVRRRTKCVARKSARRPPPQWFNRRPSHQLRNKKKKKKKSDDDSPSHRLTYTHMSQQPAIGLIFNLLLHFSSRVFELGSIVKDPAMVQSHGQIPY
jgi:hypothetical protein